MSLHVLDETMQTLIVVLAVYRLWRMIGVKGETEG